MQPGDAEVFARLVEATAVDDTHILGGCRGGDALLARLLSARGAMVHVVLPADRSQIDPEWQLFCSSFEEMPGGTTCDRKREHKSRGRTPRLLLSSIRGTSEHLYFSTPMQDMRVSHLRHAIVKQSRVQYGVLMRRCGREREQTQ
ncbi:hypothetical protein SE17_29575 [Kouleothrix aurantiaca]|uniref:Uncharacterized protein n=1 Tax=Kouleothrix aurantiaca TaxID=186479 RepID=A0A0N8PRI0_9CHLR|nr:hypothetical protein SE17_29575 [Kouleothrix aurantiaca]